MKNRSNLFYFFQTFYNEIKNRFGVFIQILRSDNDQEYLLNSFKQFVHGIINQN